jgi:hypothetical protein
MTARVRLALHLELVPGLCALTGVLAGVLPPGTSRAADATGPGGAAAGAGTPAATSSPVRPAAAPIVLPPPLVPPAGTAAPVPGAGESPPTPVVPIPTADEAPAASDHDAVVGHLGIEARRFDSGPLPLALRPGFGCPAVVTAPCEVTMGSIGVRKWTTRNFAWNGGLVLSAGGGRDGTQTLDTYFGFGPIVGMNVLLGNWRHLAVSASPDLSFVWFRPGPGEVTQSTTMIALRAALEAELHFGFVGVPALSIGMLAGLGFRYQSGPDERLWSIGVIGAQSVWGTLTNLFVRYYL